MEDSDLVTGQEKTENKKEVEPRKGLLSSSPSFDIIARGLNNRFNPAMSGTFTFIGGWSNGQGTPEEIPTYFGGDYFGSGATGLRLQEAEIRLSSVVDPYFRADMIVTSHGSSIALEEAFLTTLTIPSVNIRAGYLSANLGRHNTLHTHAFPFLEAPLPWRALLGEEGLRNAGISADILLPLPFYAEINLQAFYQNNWGLFQAAMHDENEEHDENEGHDEHEEETPETSDGHGHEGESGDRNFAYLGHLKLLFPLGESTTMTLGGTYLGGRNEAQGITHIVGGDFTLKWNPIKKERYKSVAWTTEYLWANRQVGTEEDHEIHPVSVGGIYSGLRVQFAQRWWIQGRGALLGLPANVEENKQDPRTWRTEALFAFVPSEFFSHPPPICLRRCLGGRKCFTCTRSFSTSYRIYWRPSCTCLLRNAYVEHSKITNEIYSHRCMGCCLPRHHRSFLYR